MANYFDVRGQVQHINGTQGNDTFVINGNSSNYGWGRTQDGRGIVVWSGSDFDILYDVENVQFNDGTVTYRADGSFSFSYGAGSSGGGSSAGGSGSGSGKTYYDVHGETQYIHGTAGTDKYVIDGHSSHYGWGLTHDGKGIVVWTGSNFDILYDVEQVQFSDGYVTYEHGRFEYHPGKGDGGGSGGGGGGGGGGGKPNNPPHANDDSAWTNANESVTINALGNDSDPDGDRIQIVDFSNGANGRVSVNADGTFTYTPNPGFQGKDSFSYRISDGNGGFDEARVWVDVNPPAAPKENHARLVGDEHINEGESGYYKIELDHAVTEDTWFTVRVRDGSANRIDRDDHEVRNQDIIWGGSYTKTVTHKNWLGWKIKEEKHVIHDRVPHEDGSDHAAVGPDGKDNWDYTVYDDHGRVNHGDFIKVHVKAGQKVSDSFHVEAWKEKVTHDRDNHGVPAFREEGKEDFHLEITDVDSGGSDHIKVRDGKLHVDIWDQTKYKFVSPIALDLNGDGEIGVTGETSSFQKDSDAELGRTVEFDIDGDGDLESIEWFDGSGDGILIDNRDGNAATDMNGSRLFGDEGGQFDNGYEKLRQLDLNKDGVLDDKELEGLELWLDDGDAVVEAGELQSLADHGIAQISTQEEIVTGEDGRQYIRSTATTEDGRVILTEDVWFAQDESKKYGEQTVSYANENDTETEPKNDYNMEMRFFEADYA